MATLYQVADGNVAIAADLNQLVVALQTVLGVTDNSQALPKVVKKTTRVYTVGSYTWNKPANLVYIVIKAQAGGGGGGGCTSSSNQLSAAAGGGGGAYCEKMVLASALGATLAVVVGAGGTGGVAPNAGNAGGNTTIGALVAAGSGSGGTGRSGGIAPGVQGASFPYTSGGEIITGGDINILGGTGYGYRIEVPTGISNLIGAMNLGGAGGNSFLGHGAPLNMGKTIAGIDGRGYGSGGSGATCGASGSSDSKNGGAGANGLAIIEEYIYESP